MYLKKEDIEFLKELQHELNTQTNDGNADPVYWGIMEKREVLSMSGDIMYFHITGDDDEYTYDDFVQYITDKIIEADDKELLDEWNELDHDNYYDVSYMAEILNIDYYKVECEETDYLSRETGCFLTKRAAQNYIDKCGYNHSKPRTYAMTAYRNYELERLLKILKETDFNDIKIDE